MKRYIYAMAIDNQTAKNQLFSISLELTEHLIKLYLFANTEYANHWKQEIYSFLHRVPKLKSKKRYPSYKLVREAIGAYDDSLEEMVKSIMQEYPSLIPTRSDIKELTDIVLQYFDWISHQLSEKGVVRSSEVYAKLSELGL